MKKALSRRRAEHGQRRQHPEFRIAAPVWDAGERARLIPVVTELAGVDEKIRAAQASKAELPEHELADAATQLWRAERRIARLAETESREAKRIGRNLASTREALAAAGVTIQDHEGDDYHEGQSLEVLAFESDPAATRETVRETVRPSIYLAGRRVQMGQVIVGGPAAEAENQHA